MRKTPELIRTKKSTGEKIVMLTCYDALMASIIDGAGIDVLLVGDSVGTNILGYESVRDVTMDHMIHHVGAVARKVTQAMVLADMPFGSCPDPDTAIRHARILMDAGADAVKIEGELESADLIHSVVRSGIPVCGHIGYTPQSIGPKASVQGKDVARATILIESARSLQKAGVFMLVLELMPEELSREVTHLVSVPTIGIGAGRYCDGQVQVITDVLGLSARTYRHSRAYCQARALVENAARAYAEEVRHGRFPGQENTTSVPEHVVREALSLVQPRNREVVN